MTSRLLALCLLLWSPMGLAARSQSLLQAIKLYDDTEFAKAKDQLVTLVEAPGLSDAERSEAISYLAASYHAIGDVASARAQLHRLARAFPATRLDPGLFLPDLVALADQARSDVARETPSSPLVYAFLPFGVGQFKNGQTEKGLAFLGGEALALGSFAVTLAMFESSKLEGEFLQWGRFQDPVAAGTLQTVYLVSFWVGLALMGGGVVDAIASRESPPSGVSLRIRPSGLEVSF